MAIWASDKNIQTKTVAPSGFISDPNRMWCMTITYAHESNNVNCYRTYETQINAEDKEILCTMLKLMYQGTQALDHSHNYTVPFEGSNYLIHIGYGWHRPQGAVWDYWKSNHKKKSPPKPFPFESHAIKPLLDHLFQWKS
jgi:hypothetical protein